MEYHASENVTPANDILFQKMKLNAWLSRDSFSKKLSYWNYTFIFAEMKKEIVFITNKIDIIRLFVHLTLEQFALEKVKHITFGGSKSYLTGSKPVFLVVRLSQILGSLTKTWRTLTTWETGILKFSSFSYFSDVLFNLILLVLNFTSRKVT